MMYENFLGNKTAWKILRILSESPGRGTSRAEIRELARAGNFALSKALKELIRYGILLKKKIGKKEIYWLNSANTVVQEILKLFEIERTRLKNLQPSKVIFLAKILDKINSILSPESIILFGSHAKGTATEESDFDLCVIVKKKKGQRLALASLPENVQIHLFEEKEFEELKQRKDTLVEEILRDGIKLV